MGSRALPCVLAAILSLTTPIVAQQETSAPVPVPLRLIVTDARGRAISGLTAADIEVTEGARQHTVQSIASSRRSAPRKIALLLDDYHVSSGANSTRARIALLDFLDRSVRADDVLFVMKPLDPAASVAALRTKDDLRAAIVKFEGRKGNYAPQSPLEAELMSAAPPTAPRQRAQVARAAMQALVTRLSARDAGDASTRAVIVVTEGFAPEDRGGRERLATLRTVARSARLANVAMYVVDPASEPQSPSAFTDQWQALTAQTGGLLTTAGATLDAALARISADLDEHYIVTLPPAPEDGTFHPVTVTVKRPGATVRAPSGYWTPIAAERLSPPTRPAMSTYLKTPHLSGLIQPWFRMARGTGGRTTVTFSWAPRSTRAKEASVEFSAVTFEGLQLFPTRVIPQGTGADARAIFDALPGAIQVSMAIKDASGKVVDTDVRYIDVPTLDTRGPMIAAVELVRTRTLREFERVQLQDDAMPADTREFDHRDRVIVRVRAFGAGGTVPGVTVRMLTPGGQQIADLAPLPLVGGLAQFDLPLARYPSGDYRIEVRASDGTSATSQLITFRLVG